MCCSKKTTGIILVAVLLIQLIVVGSLSADALNQATRPNAETTNGYPISLSVKTDADSYFLWDVASITVSIRNESENKIKNISCVSAFDGLQPVRKSSTLQCSKDVLNAGESFTYSYSVMLQPNKTNIFFRAFLMIKSFFVGRLSAPGYTIDENKSITKENVTMKFSSVIITDTVFIQYDYETNIINTAGETDFFFETQKLVDETMTDQNFDPEKAKNDDYYACRVIAKCNDLSSLDYQGLQADTVVTGEDGAVVLQFANRDLAVACTEKLQNLQSIEYAEPDAYVSLMPETVIEDVPGADSLSWGESFIKADQYSQYLSYNNKNDLIKIAVVDTGVQTDHPFLKNKILASGANFVGGANTDYQDYNGHGTHVAGIIADCVNNLNIKIMPVRVLDASGSSYRLSVANGIRYAANNGADVINLSLGGGHSSYTDDAIEYAIQTKGAVICVASGNGDEWGKGTNTSGLCPAHMEEVIVVGALSSDGKIAPFSNFGASVDVAAPGVRIASSYKDGQFKVLSGTSMATPHVSAVAAMLLLEHPHASPAQIETLVKQYCKDLGATGRDDYFGTGCPNLYDAIPDCRIQFNTNGGNAIADINTKNSSSVTLPTPKKSYRITYKANGGTISSTSQTAYCPFDGWYTLPNFSSDRLEENSLHMVLRDETLYAKWNDAKPNFKNLNPTRQNYRFVGWFTASSGGTEYTALTPVTKNITLYAHWEQIMLTVPNLIGNSYQNAKNTLTAMGFNVSLQSQYNSADSGKVFQQSPSANTQAAQGSTVTIYYSLGQKPIGINDWVVFAGGDTWGTVGDWNTYKYRDASEVRITDIWNDYYGIAYNPDPSYPRICWVHKSLIYPIY